MTKCGSRCGALDAPSAELICLDLSSAKGEASWVKIGVNELELRGGDSTEFSYKQLLAATSSGLRPCSFSPTLQCTTSTCSFIPFLSRISPALRTEDGSTSLAKNSQPNALQPNSGYMQLAPVPMSKPRTSVVRDDDDKGDRDERREFIQST